MMKKQIQSVFNLAAIICFLLTLASCGGRGKAVNQLDDMARQIRKEIHETEMPKTAKPKRGGDKSKYFTPDDHDEMEEEEPAYQPMTIDWQPVNYPQQQITQEQMDELWREWCRLQAESQRLMNNNF